MTTRPFRLVLCLTALVAVLAPVSISEKVDMSPENLVKTATDVITGKVTAIYAREESRGGYDYTHYAAEVKVATVEKMGARMIEVGDVMYVRYWTKKAGFFTPPAVGTNGHRGRPDVGDSKRIYLARNAYDGFDPKNADGGYNVIGANGFESIPE